MFANTRLLLVASILCCFWQHIDASGFFKKEFNFDEVDAVLRADGMRADGSASETKKHIENFVPPKDSNIKREMEFLRQLCIFEFRHCRKNLGKTAKAVKSIRDNSKLSTALWNFAVERETKMILTCMQEIENFSPEKEIGGKIRFDFERLKGVRTEEDLDHYKLLEIVKSGYRVDQEGRDRFDRAFSLINFYHKLVAQRMKKLGIQSYSIDSLKGKAAKRVYALYLVRRRFNHLGWDLRKFIQLKSKLHKTLLENIYSGSRMSKGKWFYFDNIKALARREMRTPNIILELGIGGADEIHIRKALEDLLGEACRPDIMSSLYELVGLDKWDNELPMDSQMKGVAAMCFWSRCETPHAPNSPPGWLKG